MNLIGRAKLATRNRFFALQQLDFYSKKGSDWIPKTVQLTRPKTRKSSGSSSFSQRIKEQTGALTVWPKPTGIPYQAKIANLVNVIGYVKTPVRFEAAADGKQHTAILISPESSGGKNNSALIPVVFEGDLAHVVAYHVKENDHVFVSGRLSVEPSGFAFSEIGRLHVMAESLNYVEGLEGNVSVNNDKPGIEKIEAGKKLLDQNDVNLIVQHLMEQLKSLSVAKNDNGLAASIESSGFPRLHTDTDAATSEAVEAKVAEGDDSDAESSKETKGSEESWRNLLIRSRDWWDYRPHKANGLVKEKFPDFRHKENGEGLWVNSAPDWVLTGIKKLEFDVKFIKPIPVQGSGWTGGKKSENKKEDLWKQMVENPAKWWDNRSNKRSSKAPDFKHKETGEALWLGSAPDWVLSKLPPLKNRQSV